MDPGAGPSTSRGGARSSRGNSRGAAAGGRSWRGRGFWRPYNRGGGPGGPPRERPVGYALPRLDDDGEQSADRGSPSGLLPVGSQSSQQPLLSVMLEKEPCEYPGWKLYLPQEGWLYVASVGNLRIILDMYFRISRGVIHSAKDSGSGTTLW